MDLGAYAQKDSLDAVAKANGINIPSLRGYRLMEKEEPLDEEEIAKGLNDLVGIYWWLASDKVDPQWYDLKEKDYHEGHRPPRIPRGDWWTEYVGEDEPGFLDTDSKFWKVKRVHRTSLFQSLGMLKARHRWQWMLWNRYAGQEGVLYIHSRLGGSGRTDCEYSDEDNNLYWPEGWDVRDQPWFLDVCADAFDRTYCDIYARIDPETLKGKGNEIEKEE